MAPRTLGASIGLWALALGGTGFVAGFFGPIIVNPEANQGPLLGIFITGPGGAIAGLVLGAIFRSLQALVAACATLALGTLYFCLPDPAVLAHVIDAEVEECSSPKMALDAALAEWEEAVAQVTWTDPAAGWKEAAIRSVERDPGVVLTMKIARRATIYGHRKPWNSGRKTAGPWTAVEAPERYYARDAGSSCAAYLARARDLYMPFTDSTSGPNEPARVWPPSEATAFLRLMQLGPVPEEYRRLLR